MHPISMQCSTCNALQVSILLDETRGRALQVRRSKGPLLITHYLLPTTYYFGFLTYVCRYKPTTHCPLPTTHCPLPSTYYLLPTTHNPLLTTHYLPPTTYYSLLTTHYLLPTTYYLGFSPLDADQSPLRSSQILVEPYQRPSGNYAVVSGRRSRVDLNLSSADSS